MVVGVSIILFHCYLFHSYVSETKDTAVSYYKYNAISNVSHTKDSAISYTKDSVISYISHTKDSVISYISHTKDSVISYISHTKDSAISYVSYTKDSDGYNPHESIFLFPQRCCRPCLPCLRTRPPQPRARPMPLQIASTGPVRGTGPESQG